MCPFTTWLIGLTFIPLLESPSVGPYLHPYFSHQGAGTSVTMCLVSDHTEKFPDSSSKTSVTHLRSCDMGFPQGANSQLPPKEVSV